MTMNTKTCPADGGELTGDPLTCAKCRRQWTASGSEIAARFMPRDYSETLQALPPTIGEGLRNGSWARDYGLKQTSQPCADVIAIYEEMRRRGVDVVADEEFDLRCAHGEWEWHEVAKAAEVQR